MPVVRKLASVCALAAGVALATASVAAAAGGGFAPPPAHSPNVHHTNIAYWTVFGFTTFNSVFLLLMLASCCGRHARGDAMDAWNRAQVKEILDAAR